MKERFKRGIIHNYNTLNNEKAKNTVIIIIYVNSVATEKKRLIKEYINK